MKIKVKEKEIKNGYNNIISVGYCDLSHLLSSKDADFYTCGVYGWNADIYKINYNTVIVTGYRPFGNIHASYKGITKKYNEKARKIYNSDRSYESKKKSISKLLEKFIKECLENVVDGLEM